MDLIDDDVLEGHISRVIPMEHDDADSDDLQFVDNLNMEPLEQQGNTVITSQSAAPSQLPLISQEIPASNTIEQETADSTSQAEPTISSKEEPSVMEDVPKMSPVQDVLPIPIPTFGQDTLSLNANKTEQPTNIPMEETPTSQALVESSADVVLPDTESSVSSQSDKTITTFDAADEGKSEPTTPIPIIIKHHIEGFTIEESTEPFPVHRSSLLTELQQRTKKKKVITRRRTIAGSVVSQFPLIQGGSRPASASKAKRTSQVVSVPDKSAAAQCYGQVTELPTAPYEDEEFCSMCGNICINLCFYRGEPFCSRPCVKKRKSVIFANPETAPPRRGRPVGALTRNKPTFRNSGQLAKITFSRYRPKALQASAGHRMGGDDNLSGRTNLNSSMSFTPGLYGSFPSENGYGSDDSLLAGSELVDSAYRRCDVMRWTVSDVREFIQSLEGCERYCIDFEEQEIDGRALLLLNEDHLLNALDIKLGPAVKIYQQINSFR